MNAKELSVEETKKALVLRDLVMSGKADLKAARAATGLARMAYDWTRFGHRLEREENASPAKKPGRKRLPRAK